MEKPSPTLAVRTEERRRLARTLEEGVGQSLNLVAEQADAYRAAPFSLTQARAAFDTLSGMIARTLTDLNDLVADLGARDLDLGLVTALETLALRIERRYGLTVTLDLAENFLKGEHNVPRTWPRPVTTLPGKHCTTPGSTPVPAASASACAQTRRGCN